MSKSNHSSARNRGPEYLEKIKKAKKIAHILILLSSTIPILIFVDIVFPDQNTPSVDSQEKINAHSSDQRSQSPINTQNPTPELTIAKIKATAPKEVIRCIDIIQKHEDFTRELLNAMGFLQKRKLDFDSVIKKFENGLDQDEKYLCTKKVIQVLKDFRDLYNKRGMPESNKYKEEKFDYARILAKNFSPIGTTIGYYFDRELLNGARQKNTKEDLSEPYKKLISEISITPTPSIDEKREILESHFKGEGNCKENVNTLFPDLTSKEVLEIGALCKSYRDEVGGNKEKYFKKALDKIKGKNESDNN